MLSYKNNVHQCLFQIRLGHGQVEWLEESCALMQKWTLEKGKSLTGLSAYAKKEKVGGEYKITPRGVRALNKMNKEVKAIANAIYEDYLN